MGKRAVITGLGIIAPNAENVSEFLSSLKAGKSGIAQISSFDTSSFRVHIGGEIKGLENPPPNLDRVTQLALIATQEAVRDSNLELKDLEKAKLIFGTLSGGVLSLEEYLLQGKRDAYFETKVFAGTTAKYICQKFNLQEDFLTLSQACATGTMVVGFALDQVRSGKAEIVLALGSETFNLTTFAGFHALRALDPLGCRPFDRQRQGLVVGEGAGCLILENLDHAKKRGADIYAEVCGYGLSSDAYHETAPDPEGKGALRAMQLALEDAQIFPPEISYINAHGTGTPQNDRMETLAIKKLFGDQAYQIPISSTKSMIGHLMGAAGVVETIASLLALKYSFVPPTINYQVPDPECDLDYVPNFSREKNLEVALSNSFGFGGSNAAIVFRKFT